MKVAFFLLPTLLIAGCAMRPISPAQRAAAENDVREDRPHPPALALRIPGDPGDPLRCYDNGQDTVCKRAPN